MSLDNKIWLKQLSEYPQVSECIGKSKTPLDALPSYEYLNDIRKEIPKELYAYYLRTLLKMSTRNVSKEMRLNMLNGVLWEDIMFQDELDAINSWNENIIIYRGAESSEQTPGLSWSIHRHIAEHSEFNRGRVFKAVIPKNQILLYLAHEEPEDEIIANVIEGYEIL
jgi:hypothetical protein